MIWWYALKIIELANRIISSILQLEFNSHYESVRARFAEQWDNIERLFASNIICFEVRCKCRTAWSKHIFLWLLVVLLRVDILLLFIWLNCMCSLLTCMCLFFNIGQSKDALKYKQLSTYIHRGYPHFFAYSY